MTAAAWSIVPEGECGIWRDIYIYIYIFIIIFGVIYARGLSSLRSKCCTRRPHRSPRLTPSSRKGRHSNQPITDQLRLGTRAPPRAFLRIYIITTIKRGIVQKKTTFFASFSAHDARLPLHPYNQRWEKLCSTRLLRWLGVVLAELLWFWGSHAL